MKTRPCLAVIGATALLGGVIYHASLHVATGPAQGMALEGRADRLPPQRGTLRIGMFNIHGAKGSDGRRDLDRVAACLGDLDFVALNEVHGPAPWETESQARRLGQRLGMAWLFAPAVRQWYHCEFGNGLLSALPVRFWQRIPLPRQYDRSHRNAVLVGLELDGRTVRVLLTHICQRDEAEREAQLRAVIAMYLSLAEPAILAGDLNSAADDPQIRQLLATPGVVDPLGEILAKKSPAGDISGRVDWVFARGFRCVDAGICDNGASDHPMIWAELRLTPFPAPVDSTPTGW